jgi:hypothetical protein
MIHDRNFDDWFAEQEARKLKCGCIDSCLNQIEYKKISFDKYEKYHTKKYEKYKILNGYYWSDEFVSQKNFLKGLKISILNNWIDIFQSYNSCKNTFEDNYRFRFINDYQNDMIFVKGLCNYNNSIPFDSPEPYMISYNEKYIDFCIENDLIDASTEQIYRRFYLKNIKSYGHYPSFKNIVKKLCQNNYLLNI